MNKKQRKKYWKKRVLCVDCKVDTVIIRERFMVNDHVWSNSKMTKDGGSLCIGCLETRLNRKLKRRDFFCCPLNIEVYFHPQTASKRLHKRLNKI